MQAQVAVPSRVNATSAFWSLTPVAITTNCLPDRRGGLHREWPMAS